MANENLPVIWIGSQDTKVRIPQHLLYKEVLFYKKCHYKSLTLRVGDFVLISNADAIDPDSVSGCDVANILYLYELFDPFSKSDPYRAIVQWYSKPEAIGLKNFKNLNIDCDLEVVEDYRPFDNDVSIETIFDKCEVFFCKESESVGSVIKYNGKFEYAFACRYKCENKGRKICVAPVIPSTPLKTIENRLSPTKSSKKCLGLEFVDINKFSSSENSDLESHINVNNYKKISDKDKKELSLDHDDIFKTNSFNRKRNSNEHDKDRNELIYLSPTKQIKSVFENSTVTSKEISENSEILKLKIKFLKTPVKTPKRSRRLSQYKESITPSKVVTPKRSTRKSLCYKEIDDITDNFNEILSVKTPSKIEKLKTKTKTQTDGVYSLNTKISQDYNENVSKINNTAKISKTDNTARTPKINNTPKSSKINNVSKISSIDIHQEMRDKLFVGALTKLSDNEKIKSLPCRENEFQNIYKFLLGKIRDQTGGSMYISGVPGTGKTATVTAVINRLKHDSQNGDLQEFEYIEINGMRLTEPHQAYVQIYKELTGKIVSWNHAQSLLEKRFTTPSPRRNTMILLVDEFDILCNRRQDVIYNLLDWPTKSAAKLVVITIANTMDLPERVLMGKVTSRLGLTRLTFSPYTFQQLQEIVCRRLGEMQSFKSDAIQLVARKVAAVSGDARRALNICRRAVEICQNNKDANQIVNMTHVQEALNENLSNIKVQALQNCSKLEKIFIQAIAAEIQRTGVEETTFNAVFTQMKSIASFVGIYLPSVSNVIAICLRLGAQRLILCEHPKRGIHMKILLNISTDDIHYGIEIEK